MRSSGTEVESFVNWDGTMDIEFFTDSNGFNKFLKTKMNVTISIHVLISSINNITL